MKFSTLLEVNRGMAINKISKMPLDDLVSLYENGDTKFHLMNALMKEIIKRWEKYSTKDLFSFHLYRNMHSSFRSELNTAILNIIASRELTAEQLDKITKKIIKMESPAIAKIAKRSDVSFSKIFSLYDEKLYDFEIAILEGLVARKDVAVIDAVTLLARAKKFNPRFYSEKISTIIATRMKKLSTERILNIKYFLTEYREWGTECGHLFPVRQEIGECRTTSLEVQEIILQIMYPTLALKTNISFDDALSYWDEIDYRNDSKEKIAQKLLKRKDATIEQVHYISEQITYPKNMAISIKKTCAKLFEAASTKELVAIVETKFKENSCRKLAIKTLKKREL